MSGFKAIPGNDPGEVGGQPAGSGFGLPAFGDFRDLKGEDLGYPFLSGRGRCGHSPGSRAQFVLEEKAFANRAPEIGRRGHD